MDVREQIKLIEMSLEEFVDEILEENQKDIEELRRLQEVLEQLQREETQIYLVSVTSNL